MGKLKINMEYYEKEFGITNEDEAFFMDDYGVLPSEYGPLLDVMQKYWMLILDGKEVTRGAFESEINEIYHRKPYKDYHFCEALALFYKRNHRWEEVFDSLYGSFNKYEYLNRG